MQSVSSRIWTRVTVSNSCDDNHYTTGTSYYTTGTSYYTTGTSYIHIIIIIIIIIIIDVVVTIIIIWIYDQLNKMRNLVTVFNLRLNINILARLNESWYYSNAYIF